VYIKEWAEQKGWAVDSQAVERLCRKNLPANHIFSMLEPYFRSHNPINSEQQAGKEEMEIEVEY
jgi:hypothetical protein